MKQHNSKTSLPITMGVALTFFVSLQADARSYRVFMIPNGLSFLCSNCHINPSGGGARTPFGESVRQIVGSSSNSFWSTALAQLDSDGDGVSNGIELIDPQGIWKQGDANPGNAVDVTNPGDPVSFPVNVPGEITSPGESWITALSGSNVVPSIQSAARGIAVVRLHEPEKKLAYWLNVFEIDNVQASHIHLGAPGVTGDVALTLETPIDGVSQGVLDVTDQDIQNLKSGLFYVNVHTTQYPVGEIRGQFEDNPLEFIAYLDGSQVVPPVTSSGRGVFTVKLSEDLTMISYTLSVTGLTDITTAHVHLGKIGESGSVVIPIASGSFTETGGSAVITSEQLEFLLSEQFYVNVHTTQNPAGEIRGQIVYPPFADVPATPVNGWALYR